MNEDIKTIQWQYAVTATLPNHQVSYGDIWTMNSNAGTKILQLDPEASYALWVCRSEWDNITSRPHSHGVLICRIEPKKLMRCFYGLGAKIEPIYDLVGWLNYIQLQALPETLTQHIGEYAHA
jgi:hypothetical protein